MIGGDSFSYFQLLLVGAALVEDVVAVKDSSVFDHSSDVCGH